MRVIIIGEQTFDNYDKLKSVCDEILKSRSNIEIVAATQKGAGALGLRYAKEKGYLAKVFKVDFAEFGPQSIAMCYKQMVNYADALIIFWSGELYTLGLIIKWAKEKGIQVHESRHKPLKQQMKEAKAAAKAAAASATPMPKTPASQHSKDRYIAAHRRHQNANTPSVVRDHGYVSTKMPDTTTANGLTQFIVNFLNWSGHRATRINVQGRLMEKNEKQPSGAVIATKKWIKSSTAKGTADIDSTINGRSCKWEIKVGRDQPRPEQITEQQKQRSAGGIYEFIHTPEEFLEWCDRLAGW
jgi:hypothetical protein